MVAASVMMMITIKKINNCENSTNEFVLFDQLVVAHCDHESHSPRYKVAYER